MPVFDATTTSDQVISAFAPHVKGRTFVITGAGQPSIGSQMATSLAQASPGHILIASRTAAKVFPVLSAIRDIDPAIKTTFVQVDLSDHDSVRRAAGEILEATASKIDVLINSAGNMALTELTLDKQGIEMQLSGNHVGHFLLTNLLVPALLASGKENGAARIVNVTSIGYLISPFRFDDYNFSGSGGKTSTYDPWTAYGQAKTANILFSFGLTSRLQKKGGITSVAAHPGSNVDTKLGAHVPVESYGDIPTVAKRNTGVDWVWEEPRFKTYAQIGATPLVAALDPDLANRDTGAFLQDSRVVETAEYARDPEVVGRLWKLSEELVGQEFPY